MHATLRVKLKTLVAESRIIRHEEQRARKTWRRLAEKQIALDARAALHAEYDSMHHHRTAILRRDARATQLAYAFLRDVSYLTVEQPPEARKPSPGPEDAPRRALRPTRKVPVADVATIAYRFTDRLTPLPAVTEEVKAWLAAKVPEAWPPPLTPP
jgi:hypothetical protein